MRVKSVISIKRKRWSGASKRSLKPFFGRLTIMVVLRGVSEEKVRSILEKVRESVFNFVKTSNKEAPRTAKKDQIGQRSRVYVSAIAYP